MRDEAYKTGEKLYKNFAEGEKLLHKHVTEITQSYSMLEIWEQEMKTQKLARYLNLVHHTLENMEELSKTPHTCETRVEKLLVDLREALSLLAVVDLCSNEKIRQAEYNLQDLYTTREARKDAFRTLLDRQRAWWQLNKQLQKDREQTWTLPWMQKLVHETCLAYYTEPNMQTHYMLLKGETDTPYSSSVIVTRKTGDLKTDNPWKNAALKDLEILEVKIGVKEPNILFAILPENADATKRPDTETIPYNILLKEPDILETSSRLYVRTNFSFTTCVEIAEQI